MAPRPQLRRAASMRACRCHAYHTLQAWSLTCDVQCRNRIPFVRPAQACVHALCAGEGMRLIIDLEHTLMN
eukprot:125082-Prymnesium_polylepis.1